MNISTKISNTFYGVKAFAILCVVAAHMTFPQQFLSIDIVKVSLSQIGVFSFFITSGYFYSRSKGDSKNFWIKKLKTLFVPWLLFSSLVFMVSVILFDKELSVLSFLLHFTGLSSIYWYMSVLVICQFLFKFIYSVKNNAIFLILFIISIVSVILTVVGVIPSEKFTYNINIFNWLGIFSIGIYIRRKNLIESFIGIVPTAVSLVGIAFSLFIAVSINKPIWCYTSSTSLLIEIFGFILVLNISYYLSSSRLLVDIGKKSFFIYLTHVQIVGVINTRLPYDTAFLVLRPFIALCVCYLISIVFKKILGLFKLSKCNYVFGLDR